MSRLALRARLVRRLRGSDEDGFVLLESMVAITIITIIMGALGVAFLGTLASASQQRAKQTAVQVADSTMANLRSMHPSSLLSGRDKGSVDTQLGTVSATSAVYPWLQSMAEAWDTSAAAGSGPTAPVPTVATTVKPAQISYSVSQYLGYCYLPSDLSSTDCAATKPVGKTPVTYLRAVVAVTWSAPHCTPASCSYVTASLLSPDVDPVFKLNQPLPAAPQLPLTISLTYAVGDDLAQFASQANPNDSNLADSLSPTGVPPQTWAVTAGSVPSGVTVGVLGQLTGSPAAGTENKSFTATLKVTDAFLRTASTKVTITVLPPLQITNCPNTMASTTADTTFSPSAFQATGGAGSPYTWSATGLPPGVTVNGTSGAPSGQPTTVGNYQVKVQVADSSKTRTTTCSFPWTVTYPPLAAGNLDDQGSTVNAPIASVQLAASGGSGKYAWTADGLPPGLSISSGGLITGTPTQTGTFDVTATVTDATAGFSQQVDFAWAVVPGPTVTSPGDQTTGNGGTVNLALTYTCQIAPCTFKLNNGPGGTLSIGSSGTITGQVSGVGTYSNVTITVTNGDNVSSSSTPFTWQVVAVPVINDPGPQVIVPGGKASLTLTASGSTGPYTFTGTGLPAWLTLAGNGTFSGTAPATGQPAPATFTVTAKDSKGVSSAPLTMTWYVDSLAWKPIPQQSTSRSGSQWWQQNNASFDLAPYVTGGVGGYTYTLVQAPAWPNVSLSGSRIFITAPTSKQTQTFSVKVTDGSGYSVITSFKWAIT